MLSKIVLIALLVFSNISIAPAFAKESSETSTKEKVNLYLSDSNEDLILYKDKELELELTHIKNNSSALLLEEIDTENSSLVEVETVDNEELKGYINSETVVEDAELLEEHKLYAEEENEHIPIYIDDTLKDTLYEIKDNTSVLVNETDLETSKEEKFDYIYVTLNSEVEEITEELEETFDKVEEIHGFVHMDHLINLEDEEEFILERKTKNEESEEDTANDPEESVEDETKEEPSEEPIEEDIEETEDKNLEESEAVVEEELEEERAIEESKEIKEELTDESEDPAEEIEEEEEEDVTQERNTFSMMRSTQNEISTSRLGHIRGGNRLIYKTIGGKSFTATTKYQNKVYYIKKEARQGSQTYYLLSNSPSATSDVLGWMKAKDVSTHTHKGVTKSPKPLKIKGSGKATSKAWGGSKDTIHTSMNKHKGKMLHVNLTEKVGKNTWYRGKINDQGKNIWLHSSNTEKMQIKEKSTSHLGHVKGGGRSVYKTIGGKSFKANASYQNKVYYIKRQAKVGSQTYYLLSISPSATKNVLGWMKSQDLSTYSHTGVTNADKTVEIKGTSKGTSKAWGGSKDTVHASMSRFKGEPLYVNLTEKVGKNTWYRGKINGKGSNVWLHSSDTKELQIKESSTSRLGHIRGGNRTIYKAPGGSSFKASAKHRDAVYYIKRQAEFDSETYYLLSTSPSATKNVLGWVKLKDISTHTHKSVTKKSKQLAIKGTGEATSKAWGGNKNKVYSSMSRFKGQKIHVNLTEKVGKNTWYRGKINGKGANIWLHSSQTNSPNRLIVLDAGHGGKDPGASGNGLVEKEINLDITLRVEKILKARGYDVLLTRRTDVFIELKERSNIANRNNASTFLSIHANSFNGSGIGIETWWYNNNNAASSKLFAQKIQNGVINKTHARDRGVKNKNLSVNRESKMTSALLEVGFVDNVTEAIELKKPRYRNKIAIGVADGFDKYYK